MIKPVKTNILDTESNFNDVTITSLSSKYTVLENNLKEVIYELVEHQKQFKYFRDSQENMEEVIVNKGDQLKENIEISIQKMDGEIQKSLSHQKAENSRLQQQINQLTIDEGIIKNQLIVLQKRIEDIELQVGQEYLK